MNILQKFQQEILKLPDTSNERSYYSSFQNFLKDQFEGLDKHADIYTVAEETAEKGVGFPDITVRNKGKIVGWIEVKLPDDDLGNKKFEVQFSKYKDSLENIIFTNFRQWELWQWNAEGKAQKVEEITFDIRDFAIGAEKNLDKLLFKFFEGQAYDARTPKQLALALAKKTKLLSQQVEENFDEENKDSDLFKLRKTFSETLIQDISVHQFANMVAETLAYSLFLASLEYTEKHPTSPFTLTTAIDFLPKNVPILKDLYELVKKVSREIPAVHKATELLVDQLESANLEQIRHKLVEHKPGEDPVIQFYEPFLNEYDPKEREARGVYYTPKPVVDFIVRSVDYLLETKFGKKDGLASEDVNILDPATGTGTFLMSAIQQVHYRIKQKYQALGEDLVRKKFNDIVLKHILKHFYGFELMVAPYAIAHLKLTLEIERLGFDFAETYKDGDFENDRFQVFLSNTLDNPDAPPRDFFGYDSISAESEKARHVKKNKPILAIIGNPPYSGISQNAVEEVIIVKGKKKKVKTWIGKLIEDYKYTDEGHFNEKKHWLGDDYVKFIRFTQWKISQTGQGIIGMITNNGFLDNPTFRGMRYQLMQEFDEIYILNLHGSTTKKETCEDGGKDESVFNIQTGTSLSFFVKKEQKQECQIFSADLQGMRQEKFGYLLETNFDEVKWKKLEPVKPFYLFGESEVGEYETFPSIKEVFIDGSTGVQTSRDDIATAFSESELNKIIEDIKDLEITEIEKKYPIKNSYFWNITDAKEKILREDDATDKFYFRPFDERHIYYSDSLVHRRKFKVMKHFFHRENIGICCHRNIQNQANNHFFITDSINELHILDSAIGAYSYPLYLYPETNQENLLGDTERTPNLNSEFIKELSAKLGFTPSPEDIFYYAYAIFHNPTYRERYKEQLKIDFPRLPLTADSELFKKLVKKGNELVNLHLLGENPFDHSTTVFDDNSKWHVSVGGKKPENTDDWKVEKVEYDPQEKRVYVNNGQYFEGIEKKTWEFMIGGYQVLDKWLKDRKKAERCLSTEDLMHYMKIVVSLRETQKVMQEIDELIPNWPMK